MEWNLIKSCPLLCERALATIEINELDDEYLSLYTNEICERIFRMVKEKMSHCRSFESLASQMKAHLNDRYARLNRKMFNLVSFL